MLYAIGRNIMKLKYEGNKEQKAAQPKERFSKSKQGDFVLKIDTAKRRKQSGKNPGP